MRLRHGLAAWLIGALVSGPALAAEERSVIINPTTAWNHAWNEILIDLFVIGGVFGLIGAWFLVKYRTTDENAVGAAEPLNLEKALAWALVPAAIFMADDFLLSAKGWSLWNIQRSVPPNALEIKVLATRWNFEFEYPNGAKDIDLIVPVGQPVVLRMTANDVIHSFGLNEYRLKEDIMPGRITHLWFLPDKPLESKVVCVEFCGHGHSEMNSSVKAVPKADYDAWLASKTKKRTSLLEGRGATPAVALN